jgi:hypothetical protein
MYIEAPKVNLPYSAITIHKVRWAVLVMQIQQQSIAIHFLMNSGVTISGNQ